MFLKYPGGKRRHIDRLLPFLNGGKVLVEPCVGSGAVFMGTEYERYELSDINKHLINLYQYIQSDVDGFLTGCMALFVEQNHSKSRYYELRSEFNASTDVKRRSHLLVWLNKNCYNGLQRYSKKTGFNVPRGQYVKTPNVNIEAIKAFALKANQKEVNFHHASFTESLSNVPDGSHLYVDPPYSPLPAQKTNFTQYYDEKFEHDEHDLLATILFDLAEKGHHIILSDHDTPQVRARYKGCFIHTFQAQRSISASATKRTFANELIINVKHTHL